MVRQVTYVGYSEAKAYCTSLGKRLPTEIEWQFAGQGNRNGSDGEAQLFPWGEKDNATLRPTMTTGNIFHGPEPVDKYSPAGDSPFGLMSMIGNVWQMTDEYADGHTRSVILRGGSNYRPSGSGWYLPQTLRGDRSLATQLNEHEKCEWRQIILRFTVPHACLTSQAAGHRLPDGRSVRARRHDRLQMRGRPAGIGNGSPLQRELGQSLRDIRCARRVHDAHRNRRQGLGDVRQGKQHGLRQRPPPRGHLEPRR